MSYDGFCVDGPYDRKTMIHGLCFYKLAYDRHRPNWAVPGVVTIRDPWLTFGIYLFHPLTKCWHWFADAEAAPSAGPSHNLWISSPPVTSQIARDASH